MIISHKYKYIFLHTQKNAGSSIRHVLIENYNGKRIGQHTDARSARKILGRKVFNDYCKFAVVRNPYSRVVSWYNVLLKIGDGKKGHLIIKPKSFEDYILNQKDIYKDMYRRTHELWRTQWDFLNINGKLDLDHIIRYENLTSDCFFVFWQLATKRSIEMPHLKHWGDGNDWEKYYTPELKEIVYNKFKKDFEEFGYGK